MAGIYAPRPGEGGDRHGDVSGFRSGGRRRDAIRADAARQEPLATLVINASGAFLAGFLAMCALPQAWSLLLLTGVCGGYTTFSTFMTDAFILLRNRRYRAFAWYYFGTTGAGIVTLTIGVWLGSLW